MQISNTEPNTSFNVESPGPTTNYTVVNKPTSSYSVVEVVTNSLYAIRRYLFWGSSHDAGVLKWESLTSKWDEL